MNGVELKPRLYIEGKSEKGRHVYSTWSIDKSVFHGDLPSVTRKLDIIGGGKTQALMKWAVKISLGHVTEALSSHLTEGRVVDLDLLKEVEAAGRKKPEAIKEAAGDIGGRVHELIDQWILTGKTREPAEDEKPGFENFRRFVDKCGLEFVSGDLAVASVKHKYGGRLDALAIRKGKLILLDWKTSNAIRDDYALQCAGYRQALLETYGLRAERAFVVRFGKTDPWDFGIKEVAIGQAARTWKALVEFETQYQKEFWK